MQAWLATLGILACATACGRSSREPNKPPTPSVAQVRPEDSAPARTPMVVLTPEGRDEVRVRVELARSDREREIGLMNRSSLPADGGMLFLFDKDTVQTFWMKNTLIPLDMIFIKDDLTVAGVTERAEPLTLTPRTIGLPSRYVLEVNGGFAAERGITAGTRVRFVDITP